MSSPRHTSFIIQRAGEETGRCRRVLTSLHCRHVSSLPEVRSSSTTPAAPTAESEMAVRSRRRARAAPVGLPVSVPRSSSERHRRTRHVRGSPRRRSGSRRHAHSRRRNRLSSIAPNTYTPATGVLRSGQRASRGSTRRLQLRALLRRRDEIVDRTGPSDPHDRIQRRAASASPMDRRRRCGALVSSVRRRPAAHASSSATHMRPHVVSSSADRADSRWPRDPAGAALRPIPLSRSPGVSTTARAVSDAVQVLASARCG